MHTYNGVFVVAAVVAVVVFFLMKIALIILMVLMCLSPTRVAFEPFNYYFQVRNAHK